MRIAALSMLLLLSHGCAWLLYCKTDHDCAYGFSCVDRTPQLPNRKEPKVCEPN